MSDPRGSHQEPLRSSKKGEGTGTLEAELQEMALSWCEEQLIAEDRDRWRTVMDAIIVLLPNC